MADNVKAVLVVARDDKVEALRMATGLTLLDDQISVAVLGELDEADSEVQLQLESLDFADVPVNRLASNGEGFQELAAMITKSNAVFIV